jgi:hypothetical protein
MDNASALHQMDALHADAATLFKPAVAIRVRPPGFTGTPFPKDEPMAANPPDGAMIDYVLPVGVKGPVTLAVFDAKHQLVRRFSSDAKAPVLDPAKLPVPAEWIPQPSRLSTAAGMHRFVWDLRYPALGKGDAADAGARPKAGVWAPPGAYSLELTVGGKTLRQPLQLRADPRLQLPAGALQREFALAQKVAAASAQADAASTEAAALLKSLAARRSHADAATQMQLTALADKVADLSGIDAHPDQGNGMGNPPKRTDSLRALSMNLAKLQEAVDGADADPSTDAQASYASLSRTLGATLRGWEQLNTQAMAMGVKR